MKPERLRDELEAWLEEGPAAAPQDLLGAIIADFPGVSRRGTFIGEARRLLARGLAFAGVAAAATLVTVAITARGPAEGGAPAPQPTPGWVERFPERVAVVFARPFTYAIDPASGLTLKAGGNPSEMYQFTTPDLGETGAPAAAAPAIIVRTAGRGLRMDPCHTSGGGVRLVQTPRHFVDVLAQIPGVLVRDLGPATVDGRAGWSADVQLDQARACDAIWIFDDTCHCPFSSAIPDPTERRMTAVEVDGELVIIVVLAPHDAFDTWLPTATAFIDTIHFRNEGR